MDSVFAIEMVKERDCARSQRKSKKSEKRWEDVENGGSVNEDGFGAWTPKANQVY